MSMLTIMLRVLAVLTTIFGCNIYKLMPHGCKFKRREGLQAFITLLHRIWMRPFLYIACYLHIRWFVVKTMMIVTDSLKADAALMIIYFLCSLVMKYKTILISISVAYYFKHHKDTIEQILNQFLIVYQKFQRRFGHAPKINWFLFTVYFLEFYRMSAIVATKGTQDYLPYVGCGSPMSYFFGYSAMLYLCVQPFLLGLISHLGLLMLQGCYAQELHELKGIRSHTVAVYHKVLRNYIALMQLRQSFEFLLRPFVFVAMLTELNGCMLNFHLILYDRQEIGFMFYSLALALIYPLCFVYQSEFIRSVERQFGHHLLRFRYNANRQQQLQIFCLYKMVLLNVVERKRLSVFRLNRGHILECLYISWALAMFTNSILVNSPQAWREHREFTQKIH